MKRYFLAAALAAAALAGCGGSDMSTEDAGDVPRCTKANVEQGNCADTRSPRALANPNGFPNVSTRCDGFGHRVYTTTSKHFYVIADPSCPGWTQNTPEMGLVITQ